MTVALLFPPCVDPRAPYLAMPSLAAFLRRAGIEVEMRDLNVEGLLDVVRPDRIARLAHSNAERLAAAIPDALEVMRGPRFYNPHEYDRARVAIHQAIRAAGDCLEIPVKCGITPIDYDVTGKRWSRLRDLIELTADDRANLFADLFRRVIDDLSRASTLLVGVSITNHQQIVPGLLLARRLKEAGLYTVIGGTVYTKFVDALATRPAFFETFCDGLVAYEGETALATLIEELRGSRDFSRVPNYLYLERGAVKVTPTRVEDVRALPTPDFDGLPLDRYLSPEPVLPILTGKGCYFNRCKFCDIPYINHISKKAYRVRSAEQVVLDVRVLAERYGARHFVITDEALSPRLLLELADAFEQSSVPPRALVGYARLEPGFTPDACDRLARMGIKKLFFGLESGSQTTIEHMDKGVRMDDVVPVLKNCRAAGIAFHLFSMIGFPEETEALARETLQFFLDNVDVVDHPANSWDVHSFSLDERTPYFKDREIYGITLRPKVDAEDFPISAGRDWANGRGISQERVTELIEEFYGVLRRAFSAYHDHHLHLWPGFEEYTMQYATHYAGKRFDFRTGLPREGDPTIYRLRWSPAVRVGDREGPDVAIESLRIKGTMDRRLFEKLGACEGTTSEILDSLEERDQPRDACRVALRELLSVGFLELDVVMPASVRSKVA
jgi:anaerobic magnesium-protoporphyrin IX monomethyl ester cyclase